LSTTGTLFEKVVLKKVKRHIEKNGLPNAGKFGFRARHSTTLRRTRLMIHVTLNFNNNMSTAAVFMDIGKALHKTWHVVYKLYTLQFSISIENTFVKYNFRT
jgi:hypothetical protein